MTTFVFRTTSLFLLACGLLSACSGGDGDQRVTKEVCTKYAAATCSAFERCVPPWLTLAYGDAATCKARVILGCEEDLSSANVLTTNDQADRCIADVTAVSCPGLLGRQVSTCNVPGALADGAACGGNGECRSAFCKKTNGSCGVCALKQAAGGGCGVDDECQQGLVCTEGKPRQCAAPVVAGGSCDDQKPCAFGLSCAEGTCKTARAVGESCGKTEACDQLKGLFCNPTSSVCQAVGLAAAGQPCGLVDGNLVLCSAGGKCQGTLPPLLNSGTCAAAAKDGAACGTGPNAQACLPPATCENGLCALPNVSACN